MEHDLEAYRKQCAGILCGSAQEFDKSQAISL